MSLNNPQILQTTNKDVALMQHWLQGLHIIHMNEHIVS